MLGGLARWLRAAGYDAAFEPRIEDGALVDRARRSGEVLLSSDAPMFARNALRDGSVLALYVPRDPVSVQLPFVLRALRLARREPRCMACGGELVPVAKGSVLGEAPPKTLARCEEFWRCGRCAKLYWRGTHWARIERTLGGWVGPLSRTTCPP